VGSDWDVQRRIENGKASPDPPHALFLTSGQGSYGGLNAHRLLQCVHEALVLLLFVNAQHFLSKSLLAENYQLKYVPSMMADFYVPRWKLETVGSISAFPCIPDTVIWVGFGTNVTLVIEAAARVGNGPGNAGWPARLFRLCISSQGPRHLKCYFGPAKTCACAAWFAPQRRALSSSGLCVSSPSSETLSNLRKTHGFSTSGSPPTNRLNKRSESAPVASYLSH
jgi:hypothetical protein